MVREVTENAPERKKRRHAKQTEAQVAAQAEMDAARTAATARRLETRRKVVLGAALVQLAERDGEAARVLNRVRDSLTRKADRKLFGLRNLSDG